MATVTVDVDVDVDIADALCELTTAEWDKVRDDEDRRRAKVTGKAARADSPSFHDVADLLRASRHEDALLLLDRLLHPKFPSEMAVRRHHLATTTGATTPHFFNAEASQ